jgi:imidazole glycerol-phosphate synthase subunit HisH
MIVIVDYNMGNLRSVSKALEHLGASVKISSSPQDIENADKLVLPGVGAFGDACKELNALRLFDPLREFPKKKRPFLGICLGLQLLFERSEESPDAEGLGILKGSVKAFRSKTVKVPHMGWNNAMLVQKHPFTQGLEQNSFFYFVHTYYAVPEQQSVVAAQCAYGEEEFPAMVAQGSVFATQFHPEKSQAAGLQILKNFVAA